MRYVDGFVIVVPKKNVKAYKKMAELGAKTWKKYGALDYMECVGEDLSPMGMDGKPSPMFKKLLKLKPTETVFFSFIVYKNRAHRDKVNKKVMADPSMSPEAMKDMGIPFDMKRFYYGGFQALVEA